MNISKYDLLSEVHYYPKWRPFSFFTPSRVFPFLTEFTPVSELAFPLKAIPTSPNGSMEIA